jgi:Flp pilus assembly protein TadB
MEKDMQTQLKELDDKLSAVYASIEKLKKYFQVTMWITIIMVVLPVLGLLLVIPSFISLYAGALGGF